ncbi:unnamed protein product [Arctogadus glacialis]
MDLAELAALKGKRSTAQALFSKRANKLSLTGDLLGKRALIDEIRTLGVDFGKVHDTGLEYIDALGEVEKAEEEAAHAEAKTAKCLDTYTDTLRLAKETLWFKFAYVEIKLYADGAEEKCAEVERTDVNELPEEDCQVLRESLEERISMLERKVLEWETIVSEAKTTVYKQQLYNLGNRLHDWVQSWKKLKRTEELDGGEEAAPAVPNFPYAPPQSIPGMHPGVYGFRPQIKTGGNPGGAGSAGGKSWRVEPLSERPGRQARKRSQESVLQSHLRPKRVSVNGLMLGLMHCLCR